MSREAAKSKQRAMLPISFPRIVVESELIGLTFTCICFKNETSIPVLRNYWRNETGTRTTSLLNSRL